MTSRDTPDAQSDWSALVSVPNVYEIFLMCGDILHTSQGRARSMHPATLVYSLGYVSVGSCLSKSGMSV